MNGTFVGCCDGYWSQSSSTTGYVNDNLTWAIGNGGIWGYATFTVTPSSATLSCYGPTPVYGWTTVNIPIQ